jgi:hypothetical protein
MQIYRKENCSEGCIFHVSPSAFFEIPFSLLFLRIEMSLFFLFF